jgi:hypothetical protein
MMKKAYVIKKEYVVAKELADNRNQIIRVCESEREAIACLETVINNTAVYKIIEQDVIDWEATKRMEVK